MPALDKCHDQIVRALQKAGWQILPNALYLKTERIRSFIDIQAQRGNNGQLKQIIVVEAKCFSDIRTQTTDLYNAIGQYLVYRHLIAQQGLPYTLYLAVPTHAYRGVFADIGMGVVSETNVKMIVVDLESEIIERWIE